MKKNKNLYFLCIYIKAIKNNTNDTILAIIIIILIRNLTFLYIVLHI